MRIIETKVDAEIFTEDGEVGVDLFIEEHCKDGKVKQRYYEYGRLVKKILCFDGIKHEIHRSAYYENGSVKCESHHKDGRLHKIHWFHRDGSTEHEVIFANGEVFAIDGFKIPKKKDQSGKD